MSDIEAKVGQLLNDLKPIFSQSEVHEVQQFIDAGEYRLAFETLCGVIVEEAKQPPVAVKLTIKNLANQLSVDRRFWASIFEPKD